MSSPASAIERLAQFRHGIAKAALDRLLVAPGGRRNLGERKPALFPHQEHLALRLRQRQAETNEQLERLGRALEALPQAQREVFLMREEGGLTLAEIATATGSNEEAVKSRLRYAVAKLREALDG